MSERTKKNPGERLGARAGGEGKTPRARGLRDFIAKHASSSLFFAVDCLIFSGGALVGAGLVLMGVGL